MNYRSISSLLRKTFAAWNDHEAPRLGAALAFYTILSLAPLVILVVAIVALVVGRTTAQNQLLGQVQGLIGQQGADAVNAMIQHGNKPGAGAIASIIGVITLFFGASGVFGELRSALNKMWDVRPDTEGGIWNTIRQKVFSFGLVLSVGFLLLVSLIVSAALAALGKFFGGLLPLPGLFLNAVNLVISLGGITILFALIFRYVPSAKMAGKHAWIGAFATAVLFTVGKFGIGLYLGKAAVGSPYGAAGSLVVVIVWVYYSAMIFFFGAEFTHVLDCGGVVRQHSNTEHSEARRDSTGNNRVASHLRLEGLSEGPMAASERSLSQVLQDIIRDIQEIVRSEVRLAKAEIREQTTNAKDAGIFLAAAGISALFAIFFILLAAVYALVIPMPQWAAALIIASIVALSAAAAISIGLKRFKQFHATPRRTVETLRQSAEWVKQRQ